MALNRLTQGSVTYTVVGTPTIVDGVLSNTGQQNYLEINGTYPSITQSFEIQIDYTTGDNISQYPSQYVRLINIPSVSLYYAGCTVRTLDNTDLNWEIYYASNTHYIDKLVFDGVNSYSFYRNGTLVGTKTGAAPDFTQTSWYTYRIAYQDNPIVSSVNLNNTYIKVNGAAWFGTAPVEVKHINYGTSVGYTKVGNPTIVNGVASDFSASNYIKTDSSIPATASKIEVNLRFSLSDVSDWQTMFSMSADSRSRGLETAPNNQLYFSYLDTTSNNVALPLAVISNNVYYDFNLQAEGTSLTIKVLQGNTELYNQTFNNCLFSDLVYYLQFGYLSPSVFKGYIDLNNTYAKVDNKLWFFRPQTNYLIRKVGNTEKLVFADSNLYLAGPVNYTVVGSPSIVDNVASGFSASSYLDLGTPFFSSGITYEMFFDVNTGIRTSAYQGLIGCPGGAGGIFTISIIEGQLVLSVGPVGDWYFQGYGTHSFQENTHYYIKYIFDGSYHKVYFSTDNSNWTLEIEVQSSQVPQYQSGYELILGCAVQSYKPWLGSINLNNTYIKVNGDLWFYGKNYASQNIAPVPSGYTVGSTTASAIGWFDMRDQSFHAAPTGTGYCEVPPMPEPPVTIDEHTVGLWHFDEGNYKSAHDYCFGKAAGTIFPSYTSSNIYTTTSEHKFGTSCLMSQYIPQYYYAITTSSDWTVDYWAKFNSNAVFYAASGTVESGVVYGHGVQFDSANGKINLFDGTSSTVLQSEDYTFNTTDWYHLAVCRDITNSKTYVFVNGVKVMEATDSSTNPNNRMVIGSGYGYMDELRVSDNVRWTANFDVPTAAYDYSTIEHYLKAGSVSVIDGVASNFTSSNWIYFGNMFNMSYLDSLPFELHTAVKISSAASSEYSIIATDQNVNNSGTLRLTTSSDNKMRLRVDSIDITGTTNIPLDTKFYVKATYSTTEGYKLYTSTDDNTWTLEGSNASTTAIGYSSRAWMCLGTAYSSGYEFPGEIYLTDTYVTVGNNFRWDAYKEEAV